MISLAPFGAWSQHKSQFWWGISTSSYQTEESPSPEAADFFETDWDLFFQAGNLKEKKGHGVFSYSQIDRDIQALKQLGVTHYRFGVEWARVEPKPGVYDEAAFQHYGALVRKLKEAGITPIVCLWHFSFPSWLTDLRNPELNGWLHPLAEKHWANYVRKSVSTFGPDVQLYAPQNEPNAQSLAGYFLGSFPPGKKYSLGLYRRHVKRAAEFYTKAAQEIKLLQPTAKIISIQNVIRWEKAWWDVVSYFMKLGEEYNYEHLDQVAASTDIIGFNYYYRLRASPFDNPRITDPEGMEYFTETLAKRYKKPVAIMENGIADPGDDTRQAYLRGHLEALGRSRAKGYDVLGYFYWSLIDNFEWAHGYAEKFGLFAFDPVTRNITAKKSALQFAEAIKRDRLESGSKNSLAPDRSTSARGN